MGKAQASLSSFDNVSCTGELITSLSFFDDLLPIKKREKIINGIVMLGEKEYAELNLFLNTLDGKISTLQVQIKPKNKFLSVFKLNSILEMSNLKDHKTSNNYSFLGADEIGLKILPLKGFTEEGGRIKLSIKTEAGMISEYIEIVKVNGEFIAYRTNRNVKKEVESLVVKLKKNGFLNYEVLNYQLGTY